MENPYTEKEIALAQVIEDKTPGPEGQIVRKQIVALTDSIEKIVSNPRDSLSYAFEYAAAGTMILCRSKVTSDDLCDFLIATAEASGLAAALEEDLPRKKVFYGLIEGLREGEPKAQSDLSDPA